MKISVVIPVYNAERFVRATLQSVADAAARLAPGDTAEVIAVDDGSTDASGAILDAWAAEHPLLRVIHQANGGEGAARNAGMDAATGEILAFLDADDRMHPEALRVFCDLHRRTGFDLLRYSARAVTEADAPFVPLVDEPTGEVVDFATCGESPFAFCALGWATVVTRELSRQVRWTGLRQGADMVFVLDCLQKVRAAYQTRAELVNYYLDPNSISRKLSVGLLKGTCDYLPIVLAKAEALGLTPEARRAGDRLAAELLLRRLPGAWKGLSRPEDRREAEAAFWTALAALAERFAARSPRWAKGMALAARRRSLALLRVLVLGPYRLAKGRLV